MHASYLLSFQDGPKYPKGCDRTLTATFIALSLVAILPVLTGASVTWLTKGHQLNAAAVAHSQQKQYPTPAR
jgi:hypothetical protein